MVKIDLDDSGGSEHPRLKLSWRGGSAPLDHYHYDAFMTDVDEDGLDDNPVPKIRVSFLTNDAGEIDRLTMPLEPRVDADRLSAPGKASSRTSPGPRYDLLIKGGRIVDGTGNDWFLGDVAIRGDRIAQDRAGGPGTRRGCHGPSTPTSWSYRPGSSISRAIRASSS